MQLNCSDFHSELFWTSVKQRQNQLDSADQLQLLLLMLLAVDRKRKNKKWTPVHLLRRWNCTFSAFLFCFVCFTPDWLWFSSQQLAISCGWQGHIKFYQPLQLVRKKIMDILIYLHSLVLKWSLNLCDWWTRSLSSSSRSVFQCFFAVLLLDEGYFALVFSSAITQQAPLWLTQTEAQLQSLDQTATIDSMGPLLANHVDDSRRPLLGSPSLTLHYSPYSEFNRAFRCFSSCTFLKASLVEVVLCVVRTSPVVLPRPEPSASQMASCATRRRCFSEFQAHDTRQETGRLWVPVVLMLSTCTPAPRLPTALQPPSRQLATLDPLYSPPSSRPPGHTHPHKHTHILHISNGHLHARPPLPPSTHFFIFNLSPLKFALMILDSRLGGTKENQKKVRRHNHETRPLKGVSSPESRGSLCVCHHIFFF